jgi:hypothetical protein
MTEFLYRKSPSTRSGSVFSSTLKLPVAQNATSFTLATGGGSALPAIGSGKITHLRLGTDSAFEIAVCTGLMGDVVTCAALEQSWPAATQVMAVVSAEMLESYLPRDAIGLAVGNIIDVTASPYLVVGDGSDESAKLQAAADAAVALALNLSQSAWQGGARIKLLIPPGLTINIGTANINVNHWLVDFDMSGSELSSSLVTGAALSIGVPGRAMGRAEIKGVHLNRTIPAADQWCANDTAGLRVYNCQHSNIHVRQINGFRSCLQLRAEMGSSFIDGGACCYNKVYAEQLQGKFSLHLLAVDAPSGNGSWISVNDFYLGNINCLGNVGRVAGVCLESLNNDSESQLMIDNKFHSPCFQLGQGWGIDEWISDAVVGAADVGRCYRSGDFSYQVTTAGTNGTTALHELSTTAGASITSGTTVYTVEGRCRRSPFFLKNAGTKVSVYDPYSETGCGGWFTFHGPYIGGGHVIYNGQLNTYNPFSPAPCPWFEEITHDLPAPTYYQSPLGRVFNDTGPYYENDGQIERRIELTDIHKQAIEGVDGWTFSNGMVFRTLNPCAIGSLLSGFSGKSNIGAASGCKLGANGLISYNAWEGSPSVIIDTEFYKLFRIMVSNNTFSQNSTFTAYDAALNRLALSDKAIICTKAYAIPDFNWYQEVWSEKEKWVNVSDEAKYLLITWSQDFTGFETNSYIIDAFPSESKRYNQFGLYNPWFGEGRSSAGTPISGFFGQQGEFVANYSNTGAINDIIGWTVKTPGILAPAWVTGAAVYTNELRESGGKVYKAIAAGTTGSMAPTGTGADHDDGAIHWAYVGVEAALNPVYYVIPDSLDLSLHDYTQFESGAFAIGQDSNSDGLSDGLSIAGWGTPEYTISDSIVDNKQRHSFTYQSAYTSGHWIVFPINTVIGHDYFVFVLVNNCSVSAGCLWYTLGVYEKITTTGLVGGLPEIAYSPPGYNQDPNKYPNEDGDICLSWRFDNCVNELSEFRFIGDLNPSVITFPATLTLDYNKVCIIDITQAEIDFGIDLSGMTAAELYGIISPSLLTSPPTALKLTDTVTGAAQTVTVESGQIHPLPATLPSLKIGGATNYLDIDASGAVTLGGSAKITHHEQIPVTASIVQGSSVAAYASGTAAGMIANSNSDLFYTQLEIYPGWDGTDIYYEVDWLPTTDITNGQTVIWQFSWRSNAETENVNAGTAATFTVTYNSTGTTTAGTKIHSRATLAFNNANQPITVDDHIHIKIYRDATADSFAGDCIITAFEMLWTSNSLSRA